MSMSTSAIRVLCGILAASTVLLAGCAGHGGNLVPSTKNAGSTRLRTMGAGDPFEQLILQSQPTQYFELEDAACCTASNIGSSGASASGTYTSSNVTYSVAGPLQGEASTAIGLPGNTSTTATSMGVSLPNPNITGTLTVEDWVFPVFTSTNTSVNAYYTIWGYNGGHRLLISNQSTGKGQLLAQFGGKNFRSTNALNANAWNQVVFVYDGSNEYFYINGVLDSSLTVSGVSIAAAYWLGQYDTSVYYKLDGSIAQHMVFPTALSASTIQSHYAAATSGVQPTPTPTATASPTSGPGGSPQFVQQTSGSQYAPSTITVSFGKVPAAGDVLLVFFHNNGTSTNAPVTYTAPSGWVQLDADTTQTANSYEAFYYVAGSSESNSYVFTPSVASRENVWSALEFSGINPLTPIDRHGFMFVNRSSATFTTPSEIPSQAGDLAVVSMMPSAVGSFTWTNAPGWNVDLGPASPWASEVVQSQTGTVPVSETSTLSTASFGYAAIVLLTGGSGSGTSPSPSPTPTPGTGYSDWSTFGDNLQRTGYNPNEHTLNTTNVAQGLKVAWSTDLGGPITAQPILATNVSINGSPTNVLYVGAENNNFYAVSADTGAILWQNTSFGPPLHGGCQDLPGGQFGITDTATYDKTAGIVYVADANGVVHALSMTTGSEMWNTNALFDPNTGTIVGAGTQDHIYGALTLNPANGLLYAYTGSFCEVPPWHGRIVAISTSTHSVVAAFFPARTGGGKTGTSYCGGGIWGMGGASIDPVTNNVFVATGNNESTTSGGCTTIPGGETFPYGDAVVELDPQLNVLSFQTATINGSTVSGDSDYGATPMLYSVAGCGSVQASTKNKDGFVYTYGEGSGLTFEQQIQLAPKTSAGQFIGVPAYDPTNGLVFVGNPRQTGNFAHGLNAFSTSGCSGLSLIWKASIGSANATAQDNQAPTVANGVVFFTDGIDNQLWAFNDANGALLWQSGTLIGSPCSTFGIACGVFGAPTVDQRVYVGSFNHKLYAFSL